MKGNYMSNMTPRERFRAVMHFRKPDRLPLYEWVAMPDETILRWIKEGLSLEDIVDQEELFVPGELLSISCYHLFSYHQPKYFKLLDRMEEITIDFGPIPRLGCRIIEENEKYKILIDAGGIKKKIIKGRQFGMPQFLEYPVRNRVDWEKIKERFNPADPRRYPLNWSDEIIEYYKTSDYPTRLRMPGFFGFGRQLMGLENWLLAFYKTPDMVKDMEEFWVDFLIETARNVVETLKSDIDCVTIWEDMAYKNGPLLSLKYFREFILPSYKKLTTFLRKNNIDVILVDTDGDARLLIPLLLEGGVNGIYPLEVQAGMNAVALRKEYGKRLLLIGNIDKRAVAKGKEAIEREIKSKLPYLKEEGGYIPSLDHEVPPDIPYQNYMYYLKFISKFL
jgi:uroporphyrinogen decarboxylase